MDCPDCCDKGTPGGCRECGRKREATDQERQQAAWDREDDRKAATHGHR